MLKDTITVYPEEEYSKFIPQAEKVSPDERDSMYFALALKLNSGIWSNDKKLKSQDKVKIYSTADVKKYLNK